MLIILTLYLVLVWLLIAKLKLVRWGWGSGTLVVLVGATVKAGAAVKLVFDDVPGRIFEATIVDIPRGVGQGQVAASGMLARVGSIGGAKAYPAQISIPKDVDRLQLRLGMPGTATVFADNAGAIGILMSILVWISSYTAYL